MGKEAAQYRHSGAQQREWTGSSTEWGKSRDGKAAMATNSTVMLRGQGGASEVLQGAERTSKQ